MNTLKINGTISLSQFWPVGSADADTTKLQLKIESFEYSTDGGNNYQPTMAYIGTEMPVQGEKKSTIKYENQARRYINVRLQGIDAPELHYHIGNPTEIKKYNPIPEFKAINSIEYRQYMAESATVALSNHLANFADAEGKVACYFISHNLNEPKDVLDVYARFVGDIIITQNNENINHWLLRENWVLPAYYNSMLPNEIAALDSLWQQGFPLQRISGQYTNKVGTFDFGLIFREPDTNPVPNSIQDTGAVILPKLYRRQCPYAIKKKAGIENITFEKSLRNQDSADQLTFKNAFLLQGNDSPTRPLSSIFTNGKLEYQGNEVLPNDIVFIEKDNPSAKLLKKGSNAVVSVF